MIKIPVEIGKAVEACGVDFVSVHGRTRAGKYKAPVDYDAIKLWKMLFSIPSYCKWWYKDYDKNKSFKIYKCRWNMIGHGP